jgi:alpha-tubulin suppressor-like RCC1 family protein
VFTLGGLALLGLLDTGCDRSLGVTDARCGNGLADPGEACDGSDLAGQTCTDLGYEGGQLRCDERCALEVSGCGRGTGCGNGVVEPGEECEGGDLGGLGCEDIGHAAGVLACGPDCRLDESGCHTCGNDRVEADETCDGSDLGGATCADVGFYEGWPVCTPDCREVLYSECRFFCGDGERNGSETCDGSDLASAICADLGYAPGGVLSCRPDCTLDVTECCGDGTRVPEELCEGSDLGGMTCVGLGQGFLGGTLACDDRCTYDSSGCHRCGDGHCGDGETASSCPGDCGVTQVVTRYGRTCAVLMDQTVRCWGMVPVSYNPVLGTDYLAVSGPEPVLPPEAATGVTVIALEVDQTCVLGAAGTVWCGYFRADGSVDFRAVEGLTDVVTIAAGDQHACAARSDGSVWCWGSNQRLALGRDDVTSSEVPLLVEGVFDAVELTATRSTTCARLLEGDVYCWGGGYEGMLGNGARTDRSTAEPVPGIRGAVSVSLGKAHGCAAIDDGTAWCWGTRSGLVFGDTTGYDEAMPPVQVTIISEPVVSIGVGSLFICALDPAGVIRCWGDGEDGQLGRAPGVPYGLALPIDDLPPARAVSAGSHEACALLQDSTVRCWGDNGYGQLGSGAIDTGQPQRVAGLTDVVSVSARGRETCALSAGGAVTCWYRSPEVLALPDAAESVSRGDLHTCALLVNGEVWCQGSNGEGQLGDGTTESWSQPVRVVDLPAAMDLSAGHRHTCAVLTDGTLRCWGRNVEGQLGDGREVPYSASPVVVEGLDDVVAISAGVVHTCAVRGTGTAHCWGDNSFGGLGDLTGESSRTPVQVAWVTDAVGVLAASASSYFSLQHYEFSCVLHGDGEVSCWGFQWMLGWGVLCLEGDVPMNSGPRRIDGLQDVVSLVRSSEGHVCAIRGDGTAACWGECRALQIGLGCLHPQCLVEITDLAGVVSITGGGEHTCAALDDGTVWCWGENGDGRLGTGQASRSPAPVEPTGL